MTKTIFYDPTSLNGKYQIMADTELTGKGIKKVGTGYITTQNNIIYKNLNKYWVSAEALDLLINNNAKRSCL